MLAGLRAVIFDFDYTLADSARGAIDCINSAFGGMGLPAASDEAICRTIGMSLSAAYERLTGDSRRDRAAEFAGLFIRRAGEVMVDKTVVFETVKPTITLLKQQGLRLGIVSTKYRFRIEEILRREGLLNYFDVIVGGEDVPVHKPDPAGLLSAIERLACSPAEVLYVGDALADAETAGRANIAFIATLSGVTPREAFNSFRVHSFISSLLELPGQLGSLWSAVGT
jgi:phosphoglycolate phosphatase